MATKVQGSTPSINTAVNNGDTIPKEYHRRVLKKIAQLTKVVYSLHTKNDENEERIESMVEEHSKVKQRLESECDTKQKEWSEERNRNRDLEGKIARLQSEKDHLLQDHNTFVDDAEKRLQLVIEDESHKLVKMKMEVSLWKDKLHAKEKEFEGLRKETAEAIEDHKARETLLELKVESLESEGKRALEDYKEELRTLKVDHETETSHLMVKHQEEMESLRHSILDEKDSAIQLEIQAIEQKYKSREVQLTENESTLTERLSKLSSELAQVRDDLAVSQQRERALQTIINEGAEEHSGLIEKEKELEKQLELKIVHYEERLQQLQEIHDSQQLELKRVTEYSNELKSTQSVLQNERDSLSSEVDALTSKLQSLKEKINMETKNHETSSTEISQKVHDLEKEISQLMKEKKALHSQYAHEIEAAHSCLSEREVALTEKHSQLIQQLVNSHQSELNQLKSAHDTAIAALHSEYELKLCEQQSQADHKYLKITTDLSQTLADKEIEYSKLKEDLDNVETAKAKKEKELNTANVIIDKANDLIRMLRDEVTQKNTQGDNLDTRLSNLQASYDALQKEFEQMIQRHKKEIIETEKNVREKTEEEMKRKAIAELSQVRSELERQFTENSQRELSTVIELKNTTIRECEEKWRKENSDLMKQVSDLEREMKSVMDSSETKISALRDHCQQETDKLANKYDQQLRDFESSKRQLISDHLQEMETLKLSLEKIHQVKIDYINNEHQKVLLETHHANHLAMDVLRMDLAGKKEEEKKELRRIHEKEMDELRKEMMSYLTVQMEEARLNFEIEQESSQKIGQAKIENLNSEILRFESVKESLETQLSDNKNDLTRVKDKLSLLMIELNDKRKELEMNERELVVFQSDAKNQLKLIEEQLKAAHSYEIESMVCQHKHQSQLMLNEFNKAKDILSRQLNTAEKKIGAMENKYKRRESRPEDIAEIHKLNEEKKEMEKKIEYLTREYRRYKMELINKEDTYYRSFGSKPQIGVLDPFEGKRRGSMPSSTKPYPSSSYGSVSQFSSPSIMSMKSEVTSLPSITSISPQEYRNIPSSPKQHQSQPSLFTPIAANVGDLSPRATASSPQLRQSHKSHITRASPSPSSLSKRPLKFLTDDSKAVLKQQPACMSRTKSNPDSVSLSNKSSFTNSQPSNSIVA